MIARTSLALLAFAVALVPLPAPAATTSPSLAPVSGASDWINGRATAAGLRGKVVIVDIFTFACFNCKNVVPNLRSLRESVSSSDLAIVGVHSPESDLEKVRSNVVENLARQGITWPVAIDNDFAIWRSYGTGYWPTQLIFDRQGRLRKTVIGDSQDALVNATVRALIAER
jgi:hypothetical protein